MISGADFRPTIALNASATSGSLNFSMSNLILVGFGLLILFRRMWKVIMITSDICSWKASCPGNVHSCVKAPFHQDVVDMIVMFSIWAVPGPSSRCFVWAKCVSQHQLFVHCKFEESVTSLICFRFAERSASVLSVVLRILSHFCIPVS